jgi:hypothetical protein
MIDLAGERSAFWAIEATERIRVLPPAGVGRAPGWTEAEKISLPQNLSSDNLLRPKLLTELFFFLSCTRRTYDLSRELPFRAPSGVDAGARVYH